MIRFGASMGKGMGVASLALASILAGAFLLGPLAAPVAAQELLAPLGLGQQGLDPQALDQSSTTPLNPAELGRWTARLRSARGAGVATMCIGQLLLKTTHTVAQHFALLGLLVHARKQPLLLIFSPG